MHNEAKQENSYMVVGMVVKMVVVEMVVKVVEVEVVLKVVEGVG